MPDANGIYTAVWGDGPRAVLVHGGGPGGTIAFAAQRPLARRWQLVLPDRPGHGASPRQGRDDFERDAGLIAPLLDDGAHLVGHSYGAMVALVVATLRPGAVRSLTLIEPPAFGIAAGDPAVDAMLRAQRAFFADPPADPARRMREMFSLIGIDRAVPEPFPDVLVESALRLTDFRSPEEAAVDPAALVAGGFPILVLTCGRLAGFEGIAAAFVARAGAHHVVVPGTDHSVQEVGGPVNDLLEAHWSAAG